MRRRPAVRALVADDSRAIRSIPGKTVRELGFEILEAGHGREVLDQLAQAGRLSGMPHRAPDPWGGMV